jgi:hypothetical protein
MTCQEFLARHAEYMDELLTSPEADRCQVHAAVCASCARYDRVVREGVQILRTFPEIEPSDDFFPRLQHRLYSLEDELRVSARGPGASAIVSLALAGVLALLAWSPLMRLDQVLLPVGGVAGGLGADEAESAVAADRGIALPSSLRPLEPRVGPWGGSRLAAEGESRNWTVIEFQDELAPGLELAPVRSGPAPAGEVWWWSGPNPPAQGLLPHSPGTTLAPRPLEYYSPLLTGGRAVGSTATRMVRATRDTLLPHN